MNEYVPAPGDVILVSGDVYKNIFVSSRFKNKHMFVFTIITCAGGEDRGWTFKITALEVNTMNFIHKSHIHKIIVKC